ncbi:MAG: ATP-dependent DNA helicase RecG [Chloroflexota bacterium]|nr:ATP-dependent DNA helicase RecG [Chloroflexota bacterium]
MKPSIAKLRKYFKLEAEHGYDNKAVIGGLGRMLDYWTAEARQDNLPENLIQAVVARLRDYHNLSEKSRQVALYGLWRRIQRELGEEPLAAAPPKKKTPPLKKKETRTPPGVESRSPKQKPTPRTRPNIASQDSANLNADVKSLNNIGSSYARRLERLGIKTLGDMLYHFPNRHDDYSKMTPINELSYEEKVSIIGTVQSVNKRKVRGGRTALVEAVISDGSSALRVSWFNQPWLSKRLRSGMQIVLSGKTSQYLGRLTMTNPAWSPIEQKNLMAKGIVPIYPLTAKITQRWLRNKIHSVVADWAPRVQDALPRSVQEKAGLMDLPTALQQIHYPDSWKQLKHAKHRLAFDEIFLLQLGVLQQKHAWDQRAGRVFEAPDSWMEAQIDRLPFKLTRAQQRSITDVRQGLSSGRPINRLLQGDVGSGKTVVAAVAIALVTRSGAQAAMMAPTSILAEQHYNSMLELLSGDAGPLKQNEIRLMIGATSDSEKEEIRSGLASGEIKLVIGTHALIQDAVEFADLQLAIVDEQHRFGVEQRASIRDKGENPHLLVMTATPIPRSLALTVYGDLDISVIDEMPPGRKAIGTYILYPRERERAYGLIRRQAEAGHQAFIIYPLVEESEKSEENAAVEEHARLQKDVFPNLKLGLLHGRLTPSDKDEVMSSFRDGEYDILVSTSVVEVGVDVPNATVMLIDGAHRFGLAQLHQFRGRVGRAGDQSYCILIPSKADEVENERLQAMVETNDGFVLAERDLEQRGPGEFLGTRQSGYSGLRLASLTDVQLIEKARHHAQELFQSDPQLVQPEHQLLANTLNRFWKQRSSDIS